MFVCMLRSDHPTLGLESVGNGDLEGEQQENVAALNFEMLLVQNVEGFTNLFAWSGWWSLSFLGLHNLD